MGLHIAAALDFGAILIVERITTNFPFTYKLRRISVSGI